MYGMAFTSARRRRSFETEDRCMTRLPFAKLHLFSDDHGDFHLPEPSRGIQGRCWKRGEHGTAHSQRGVSIFREQIMRGAIAVTFTLVWDILSVLSDCRLEKKRQKRSVVVGGGGHMLWIFKDTMHKTTRLGLCSVCVCTYARI